MAGRKKRPNGNRLSDSTGELQPFSASAIQSFDWIVGLLQAGDSFYPTGSYAHSFGLEGLTQEGVVHNRDTLREFFFLSVLPALRQAELPLAAQAWRAFGKKDWKL